MRGKLWSIGQERQLRKLVAEGVGIAQISRVMGKTLVSVRSKMYHLGLSVVDAAAVFSTIAASVASIASVASTPERIIDHAPLDDAPSQGPIIDHHPLLTQPFCRVRLTPLRLNSKRMNPLPSVKEKLRVLDAALVALERHMHRTKC